MSRRAAIGLALLAAIPACGSSDTPPAVHVGTHENPHADHRPTAADPTAHLSELLAAADVASQRRTPRRASRNAAGHRSAPISPAAAGPAAPSTALTVASTAYCETGLMADGRRTFDGAVAMNGQPLGSRWHVVETGRTYTVADRIGHGSQFDIAMPGDCDAARRYGRRTIHIERVA